MYKQIINHGMKNSENFQYIYQTITDLIFTENPGERGDSGGCGFVLYGGETAAAGTVSGLHSLSTGGNGTLFSKAVYDYFYLGIVAY